MAVTLLTIDVIQKHITSDRFWRERWHPNITLNYGLYRGTVITNHLTQRQSVNVPSGVGAGDGIVRTNFDSATRLSSE